MKLHLPTSAAVGLSAFGSLCGAVYFATIGEPERSWTLLMIGLTAFGLGAQVQTTKKSVEVTEARIKDIQDNPAMPGTPGWIEQPS